ncbi:hypothetical protein ABJI51_16695 [Amycolatopsis sp. NEAU-NG30]|uniref:Uncharacterized protein n=1 Tax=Amycolatopsis melonis TaxID=3156488 RepID=A0ABV0LEL8_9PSEU
MDPRSRESWLAVNLSTDRFPARTLKEIGQLIQRLVAEVVPADADLLGVVVWVSRLLRPVAVNFAQPGKDGVDPRRRGCGSGTIRGGGEIREATGVGCKGDDSGAAR